MVARGGPAQGCEVFKDQRPEDLEIRYVPIEVCRP